VGWRFARPRTRSTLCYGYFQTAEFLPWVAEAPDPSGARERAEIRRALRDGTWDDEGNKDALRYGGARQEVRLQRGGGGTTRGARFLGDLGVLLLSCEKGMVRQSPRGVYVYNDDDGVREELIDDATIAANDPTLQEAYDGIVLGKPIFHDGRWGLATLEVQLALMQSARERREIQLSHQVAVPSVH
jgi:phthalate 4,5-cis-dihydrodiol dehydrogenase